MRIDLVLLVLLIALVGLGYVVDDDLHVQEELRSIQAENINLEQNISNMTEEHNRLQNENDELNGNVESCQLENQNLQETISQAEQSRSEIEQQLVSITLENQTLQNENIQLRTELKTCTQVANDDQRMMLVSGDANGGESPLASAVLANAQPVLGWIVEGVLVLIVVIQTVLLWLKSMRPVRIPTGYILVSEQERQIITQLRRRQHR
jgi:regulator of replication initiation timing